MKTPLGSLDYPCASLVIDQPVEILDGIRGLRLAVPWALDHVNAWLLDEPSGDVNACSIIDTGINTKTARSTWRRVLDGRAPVKTLITHYHPDHSGLAGWFCEQGSACFGHNDEIAVMQQIMASEEDDYVAEFANWYQRHGVDEAHIAFLQHVGHGYRKTVAPLPETASWNRLQAGDRIKLGERSFTVRIGRGHAPAMIMLYCENEGFLIAADQVLPGISPNISVLPGAQDTNPLASFMASLHELETLPHDVLVLPSHGDPFTGLHQRIQTLLVHHESRLDRLRSVCTKPVQAADVLEVLFRRKLDAQQMSFALGEAIAHLRYLVHLGEMLESETDARIEFLPA